MDADTPLLAIEGLRVIFPAENDVPIEAVRHVDLTIRPGETLCLVGESGCGKSVTARAILRLLDPPGRIESGRVLFSPDGDRPDDLATLDPYGARIREVRGGEIAMIFQEPMSSLSPIHTIGDQMGEMLMLHERLSEKQARERAIELLDEVGIPGARTRIDAYTYQLSGGLRQRAMIAMALSCAPRLLIADEPTTALDVTTQKQILELLERLRRDSNTAILFITHDLGVVAEIADRVAVMYLGEVAELADVFTLFETPKHPYTQALLRSIPRPMPRAAQSRLSPIRGNVPSPQARPSGCPFHDRCDQAVSGVCERIKPEKTIIAPGHEVRCHLYGSEHAELALREAVR